MELAEFYGLGPWLTEDCGIDEGFFYGQFREVKDAPEYLLLVAVLEGAFLDYKKQRKDRQRVPLADDAELWFMNERPSKWPFAFENVCDALGLSAAAIREALGIGGQNVCRQRRVRSGKKRIRG